MTIIHIYIPNIHTLYTPFINIHPIPKEVGRKSLSIALSDTFGLRFGCAAVLWTRLGEGNPEGGGP